MKILFTLGSRGEWGYIRPIIDLCLKTRMTPLIYAMNTSVLNSYGGLVSEIENDGYEVVAKSFTAIEGDTRASMAKSMGILNLALVDTLETVRPDWVICAGDRAEQLVATTVSAYLYLPVGHIQAGERSGNIDGAARHAMARLAHLHFAANEDAEQRLIRSGEEAWRVLKTGAPQLDELYRLPELTDSEFEKATGLQKNDYLVACVHPVTEEYSTTQQLIRELTKVISQLNQTIVWILPNNDAGGKSIRDIILENRRPQDKAFTNLSRNLFLQVLKHSKAMIGNSSAGLLEAPTFEIPVLNLGRRQIDRVRGRNVIDADSEISKIQIGLKQILDPSFKKSLAGMGNPYGDGNSSERILKAISETPIDEKLLVKKLTY